MRLKELRIERKLLQKDVAEMLGVDRTTYSKYESGTSEPNFEILLKMARIFGVSTDYLLGRTDQKEEKPAPESGREASEEEIRAAFFGGADDLSEEEMAAMWNDAKDYIQYKLEQRRRRGNGGLD